MIVLDTHAWIWWASESASLPLSIRQRIDAEDAIRVPAICCWDLAMLVSKGRLGLDMDVEVWMDLALARPKVRIIPLTPRIATLSTRLPGDFHGDPADRLIVASSLSLNAPLVTKDEKITEWGFVAVCWH